MLLKVFAIFLSFYSSSAFIQNGVIHVEKAVEYYNNQENNTWKAHHNGFQYVTLSHIKSKLGLLPEQKKYEYDFHEHHGIDDLPESYDSREAYPNCPFISTIVDQSNCESCWAISTAAAVSDRFCIQSGGKVNVILSSANLLSCNKDNDGCGGGVMADAWNYVKNHGLVTGGSFGSFQGCQPYPIPPKGSIRYRNNVASAQTPKCHQHDCTNRRYKYRKEHVYKTCKTIRLDANEEKIRREIYTNGPVTAGMQVYMPFIFYNTGVFQIKGNEEMIGLHAVRLIGWGVENNVKYWIGANSWGKSWGDGGFFKILRGSNYCQIESMVHAGEPLIET